MNNNTYKTNIYTERIEEWALSRGLNNADPSKQLNKFFEEAGELATGINKGNEDLIKDSIGDVFVTLVVLTQQLGYSFDDCLELAWDEIKNRKGKMINGLFIKEDDLNGKNE